MFANDTKHIQFNQPNQTGTLSLSLSLSLSLQILYILLKPLFRGFNLGLRFHLGDFCYLYTYRVLTIPMVGISWVGPLDTKGTVPSMN